MVLDEHDKHRVLLGSSCRSYTTTYDHNHPNGTHCRFAKNIRRNKVSKIHIQMSLVITFIICKILHISNNSLIFEFYVIGQRQ